MKCNILCVGTELLLGQIVDTNSQFIAEKLFDAGIESYEQRTIGDNEDRIKKSITELLANADALIITGGLGPTHDDITREVTASVMGVDLILDDAIKNHMQSFFVKRNREMPSSNIRQAMVPQGATVINNKLGTAPGLICPIAGKHVYLVPGVPHEMKPMIEETIVPHLQKSKQGNEIIINRTIKTWGIPESELAVILNDVIVDGETSPVKIAFLARGINGIWIKLSIKSDDKVQANKLLAIEEEKVKEILGDSVYAIDDETMESMVITLLNEKGMSLSVVESLTGGMIQSRIVDVAGSSEVFIGGAVTYAKQLKQELLGVSADDVYTSECAIQMAEGIRIKTGSDIAISTTGVAGPEDEGAHPAGEVHVGISTATQNFSQLYKFSSDRVRVREYTTISALNLLRRHLLGHKLD